MIARTWRGETASHDADAYMAYLEATGPPAYRATPGTRGAYLLRRTLGGRTEFLTVSLWDDLDVVRGFAGDDIAGAVFYPENDRFLTSPVRDPTPETPGSDPKTERARKARGSRDVWGSRAVGAEATHNGAPEIRLS